VLFFLFSLMICLALSALLLTVLFKRLRRNSERKNRRPIGYLSPVFLTIIFLALSLELTAPRLLDTISLVSGRYVIEEIKVDADNIGWITIRDDGRQFTYNRWVYPLKAGNTYRITYTPLSRYIIDLEEIGDISARAEN